MIIRDAQLRAFEEQRLRDLAGKAVELAGRSRPELLAGLSSEAILGRALSGIGRALAMGLKEDSALGLFAVVTLLAGPGFELEPECRRVLEDPSLPPDARMNRLLTDRAAVPWDEIRRRRCGGAT